jgi:hypothetical protein
MPGIISFEIKSRADCKTETTLPSLQCWISYLGASESVFEHTETTGQSWNAQTLDSRSEQSGSSIHVRHFPAGFGYDLDF